MCGSRKYPYPHHGGNWKLWSGGAVKGPGNSGAEEGDLTFFDSFTLLGSKVCPYVHL